jgi:hypothetical protein
MDRLKQVMEDTLALLNEDQHAKIAEIKDREDRLHAEINPLPPDPRWFSIGWANKLREAGRECECGEPLDRKRKDDLCPACRRARMNERRARLGLKPRSVAA